MNEKMKAARLAKNIGVSRQTINMIENGVCTPLLSSPLFWLESFVCVYGYIYRKHIHIIAKCGVKV